MLWRVSGGPTFRSIFVAKSPSDSIHTSLPLLEENAGLGADKSGAEYTNDILSLLGKNAQLRGLVAKLSNIILKSVADQK